MSHDHPVLQHHPCPECRSQRTVQTALDAVAEKFYCPNCGHLWDRELPSHKVALPLPTVKPRASTQLPDEVRRLLARMEELVRQSAAIQQQLDVQAESLATLRDAAERCIRDAIASPRVVSRSDRERQ